MSLYLLITHPSCQNERLMFLVQQLRKYDEVSLWLLICLCHWLKETKGSFRLSRCCDDYLKLKFKSNFLLFHDNSKAAELFHPHSLRFITRLEPFSLPNMEYGLPARLPSLKHIVGLEEKAVGAMKIRFTAIIPNHTVPKQESRYINEVFQYIHRIWFHFGGESGIPVPGKPELVPNSGEVGSTNDPWPAVVGDSGMPERDVGKADRVGDDISGLIPACIQND